MPELVAKVNSTYYHTYPNATEADLISIVARDTTFTCNVRGMAEAYPRKTHLMQYSVGKATHGSDVAAMFYSEALFNVSVPLWGGYQSYMVSSALTGDPNLLRNKTMSDPPTIDWPLIPNVNSERLGNSVNVTNNGFSLIDDDQVLKSVCHVWRHALVEATKRGGYY